MKLNELASVIQWIDEQDEERFVIDNGGEYETFIFLDTLLDECLDKLNFTYETPEDFDKLFDALMEDSDVQASFNDLEERAEELAEELNEEMYEEIKEQKKEMEMEWRLGRML